MAMPGDGRLILLNWAFLVSCRYDQVCYVHGLVSVIQSSLVALLRPPLQEALATAVVVCTKRNCCVHAGPNEPHLCPEFIWAALNDACETTD